MGGKVAMRAALLHPEAVERLLVADIAPVVYPPHNHPIVAAMLAMPLHDGLTRAEADAALAGAVPEASVRAFLLQNLRLGTPPAWRIGLDEIAAAMADLEGWDGAGRRDLCRPRAVRRRRDLRLHPPGRPSGDPRAVPRRPLRDREARRALGARRQPGRVPGGGRGVPERARRPMSSEHATSRAGTLALPQHGLRALGPGVLAAVSCGFSDIFTKLALLAGADALTLATSRGVLGTLFVLAWLRAAPPRRLHTRRERLIALGIGLLFAGNLYLLFVAIRMVAVPIAILSYFVYPLLTGIVGAAIGLERLRLASAAAAVVALLGLALMLGADTAHLAWLGVGLAIGAALCRVATLLITRAALSGADSRLTTWYSMLSSTAALLVVCACAWGAGVPAHGGRLGGVLRGLRVQHRLDAGAVRLDGADRGVPHRAGHEPGAGGLDAAEHRGAGRGADAGAVRRRRDHAGGAVRVSGAAWVTGRPREGAIRRGAAQQAGDRRAESCPASQKVWLPQSSLLKVALSPAQMASIAPGQRPCQRRGSLAGRGSCRWCFACAEALSVSLNAHRFGERDRGLCMPPHPWHERLHQQVNLDDMVAQPVIQEIAEACVERHHLLRGPVSHWARMPSSSRMRLLWRARCACA